MDKEFIRGFSIILVVALLPIIILSCIWLYEEHDNYYYHCIDALNNNYYVEHVNKGYSDSIKVNGENITIVKYKRIHK